MPEKHTFALIGGDARQVILAGLLAEHGHIVRLFAAEREETPQGVMAAQSLTVCLEGAQCIVLPLPAEDKEGGINTPLSDQKLTPEAVIAAAGHAQLMVAGRVTQKLCNLAASRDIDLVDYLEREELAVRNAIPTAEGAIQIAMERLPITLHGARCLVIGNGRIGKVLGRLLGCLGAHVTVSARKVEDFAWIEAMGQRWVHTRHLEGILGEQDVVFNTVPHLVLDKGHLEKLRPGCLIVDLASYPGGVDFDAAKEQSIQTVWALSLPGKVAPRTAGAIIRDTIYHILRERGTPQ